MSDTVSYKYRISGLKNFITCPRMFKHSKMSEKSKVACARGSKIDEEVTRYMQALIDSKPLPDLLEKYTDILLQLDINTKATEITPQKLLLYGDHGGTVDMFVYEKSLQRITIYDWKTGSSKADPIQLKHYAWLASKLYPEAKTFYTYFMYLDQRVHTVFYPMLLEELIEYEMFYISAIESMQEAEIFDVWVAKPSWKCKFCSIKDDCDANH